MPAAGHADTTETLLLTAHTFVEMTGMCTETTLVVVYIHPEWFSGCAAGHFVQQIMHLL